MAKIGGNITATIQAKSCETDSKGIQRSKWDDYITLCGWFDLSGGDSQYTNFNAKIQESTHIFLCDYADLGGLTAEDCRVIIGGKIYSVTFIDNPMELHEHLEIYLKYIGGQ